MKKSLVLLIAGLVLVGTSACSTTAKQDDAPASLMGSSNNEQSDDLSAELDAESTGDLPDEATTSATTEAAPTTSDLSLGAGSSGRGH